MTNWFEVGRIAVLTAIAIQVAEGASSALDFTRFVQGPPTQAGTSIGADSKGYIYTVGITEGPGDFPVTKGALSLPPRSSATVFLQKLSPDGSQVLVSALLGETSSTSSGRVQAHVDASGNVYVAFAPQGNVAGSPRWLGDPAGRIAVLKIGSEGDKVLNASRVYPNFGGVAVALALDSDGSTYVAGDDYDEAQVFKLDPTGNLTNYSLRLTDTPAPGGGTYDERYLRLAVLRDHSLYVMASPSFLYKLDPTGTSILTRVNVGEGNVQLSGLATDSAGDAYVSGQPSSQYTVPSNQVGFAAPGGETALIVKLDSSGSVVYSDLFPINDITALVSDPTASVWAAGVSGVGFTLFQLDPSGTQFLHYFSLAAPVPGNWWAADNKLNGVFLDNQGRLLVAGSTTALGFPGFNRWRDVSANGGNQNQNAFFLRVSSNPPQTDLQLSVTASPTAATLYQVVTYNVQIANGGSAPANDVLLRVPPFLAGRLNPTIISCRVTSGQGTCDQYTSDWVIWLPQIGAGASVGVELQLLIPFLLTSPLHFPFVVLSATDDPTQFNNVAGADVIIAPPAFTLTRAPSAPLTVDVEGVGQTMLGCVGFPVDGCFPGLSFTGASPVRIYVPTPQLTFGVPYEFASWYDGSTDNPRTFPAGTEVPEVLMRPVTGPWVDPDAGVVHSASYRTGVVSAGEVVTLEGANLGPATLQTAQLDSQGRLATQVGGFQALFGGAPAPIVYTSATQSAVIVPYSVAGNQTVQMTMQYQQRVSNPVPLTVAPAAPGLFTANASGAGALAAYNPDNSLNTRANPAAKGDVVVLFATGEGLTNPTPPDGQIASSNPPTPQLPVTVSIAGQPAEVLYSGGVPGFTAGLMQVNVRVPQSVPPGLLPVVLSVGSSSSQTGAFIGVR